MLVVEERPFLPGGRGGAKEKKWKRKMNRAKEGGIRTND